MFYNSGDSYGANSRENGRAHGRPYENLAPTETTQAKLFADAYSPYMDGWHRQPENTGQWVQQQEREAKAIAREQLIQAERRLLAEIYFMAAIYMAGMYRNYQHHLSGNFNHLSNNFRHWVRPRYWLHEAEKTGHRLGGQWHNLAVGAGRSSARLIADARHSIGQPVWAFTRFASVCQSGNLGCAATVSELLQESGVRIPGSAGVYGVVAQLGAAGWQKIKISDKQQYRPGDVVFGVRGPHGHIGIISDTNNGRVLVCDNSSSSGTLKERTIENGGSFAPNGRFAGSLYVMRAGS